MSQLDDILRSIKPYVLGWYKEAQADTARAGLTVVEGAGIDVVLNRIGLGGDTVLVLHGDGRPADEFPGSDTGLNAASAVAESAACVIVVPGNAVISSAHTLAGCTYIFPPGLAVSGTLTTANGTRVYGLRSVVEGNNAAAVVGVLGPASGEAHLYGCAITPSNAGAGGVYAVAILGGAGDLYCHDCRLDGRGAATGTPGYAGFRGALGTGSLYVVDGGSALGKIAEDPFNE